MFEGNLPNWLAVAIAGASFFYAVMNNRGRKAQAKIKSLEAALAGKADAGPTVNLFDRVDKLEDRATRVESELEHLPSKDVTQRLEVSVANIEGEMKKLSESIKPIGAMADRIQQAMIQKAFEVTKE